MLLTSEELQPYLQKAFDHFSRDLDTPFDFVTASLVNNPIPSNFGGNILKLAVQIQKQGGDGVDGASIFKELSFMVASCIMLDSVRNRNLGPPDRILAAYLKSCNDALETFCDRHWPCEYIHSRIQGRCVNVRVGHQKGHQTKAGNLVGAGAYESNFSADLHRDFFQYCIYNNLRSLLDQLYQATTSDFSREAEEAAALHQEKVLTSFFHHLGGARKFVSFTACLCCLINVPEHILPCGHLLCTTCVHTYGIARGRCFVDMEFCPLHSVGLDGKFSTPCSIFLKPPGAGVRILCLDSVGVGSIAQLVALQYIESQLGGLPIQAFCDLIVGTGVSAIPALGLGAEGWTVDEAISTFKKICSQIFHKRNNGIAIMDPLRYLSGQARYETRLLEHELRKAFGEKSLFSGLSHQQSDSSSLARRTKVAVTTATAGGKSILLGNYGGLNRVDSGMYRFYQAEKPEDQMKVWQAARAASATPSRFHSYPDEKSGQLYQDDSFAHGCPIVPALQEAEVIWPDRILAGPDIVLSVDVRSNDDGARPSAIRKTSRLTFLSKETQTPHRSSSDHSQHAKNREHVWSSAVSQRAAKEGDNKTYIRMNLDLSDNGRKAEETLQMDRLELTANAYCNTILPTIRTIADQFLATSFYFLPDGDNTRTDHDEHTVTLEGAIHCRFPSASISIRQLGEILRRRMRAAYNKDHVERHPYFLIREIGKPAKDQRKLLEHFAVDQMISQGVFPPQRVSLILSNRMAETEFLFNLCGDGQSTELFHISGGTRCFVDEIIQGMAFFYLRR